MIILQKRNIVTIQLLNLWSLEMSRRDRSCGSPCWSLAVLDGGWWGRSQRGLIRNFRRSLFPDPSSISRISTKKKNPKKMIELHKHAAATIDIAQRIFWPFAFFARSEKTIPLFFRPSMRFRRRAGLKGPPRGLLKEIY